METKEKIKNIYSRIYDNPTDEQGNEKPNDFLGTFEVIQQLEEDTYSEEFIGTRKEDGKKYLVTGIEVSGFYNPGKGGVRYNIKQLKD